jgi:hypothetical protein
MTIVRMETPVIYFYSDTPRTVDVQVKFPQGTITEWYPQATALGPRMTTNFAERVSAAQSFIEWKGVEILGRDTKETAADKLIREKGDNHYYEARATDANFLRMKSPRGKGTEYERDLFYRGAGNFQAPLRLQLSSGDVLRLFTTNNEPMSDLIVLTIRQGMARYEKVDGITTSHPREVQLNAKQFAPLSDVRAQLMGEMAAALVKQGLYEREAAAMVNTWKHQWFEEEGVRVLYLLPRGWTDRALPLTVNPAPQKVERVMVGRAELITPQMELSLKKQVTRYMSGEKAAKLAATEAVQRLGFGRFLEPATRRVTAGKADKQFSQAAWELARDASKGDVNPPQVAEETPVPAKAPEVKKTAVLTGRWADDYVAF